MVNRTVWLLWLSISLSIQEFHSRFFRISCSLSASPIIISSLLSSSQMLLINKSTHTIFKYYLIIILLILTLFPILFIFILFNHHIQSLSYHYYLKLWFWMILFSSNHHHSHILSQSILYHSIYSININSQFQTLFFRQTINSYIKFTSISLFYFTLFLFQIIFISFICYHIHFYHQYSFQSSINYLHLTLSNQNLFLQFFQHFILVWFLTFFLDSGLLLWYNQGTGLKQQYLMHITTVFREC